MPVLVPLTKLKSYLGDAPASADDALLTALLDDVEALFASETGRSIADFTTAGEVTEVLAGTGTSALYLKYPIAEDGLVSVTLGTNEASPDETLNAFDRTVVQYDEGSRRITRVDGGTFGRAGDSRYVTVVYDHLGDRPTGAALAIQSVAATVYRNRGSEGMKSETVGSFYSYTRDDTQSVASSDTLWRAAVAASSRGQLV